MLIFSLPSIKKVVKIVLILTLVLITTLIFILIFDLVFTSVFLLILVFFLIHTIAVVPIVLIISAIVPSLSRQVIFGLNLWLLDLIIVKSLELGQLAFLLLLGLLLLRLFACPCSFVVRIIALAL